MSDLRWTSRLMWPFGIMILIQLCLRIDCWILKVDHGNLYFWVML
jgi:hypothetical protein